MHSRKPEEERTLPQPREQKDSAAEGAAAFAGMGDHPDSRYYVCNDYYHMQSDETLHILSRFQTYQQTTEYTCGAACALMVLNRFGARNYREKPLSWLVDSHPTRGTTVENMADFFDLLGWSVEFHADTAPKFESPKEFEAFVIDRIDRGIPLMVDWADWAGHWQVIIGIDTCGTESPYDDVLILVDPYDVTDHSQDGYYIFPLGRFFAMWREGPCAEKAVAYRQPFVAAWPGELPPLPVKTEEDGELHRAVERIRQMEHSFEQLTRALAADPGALRQARQLQRHFQTLSRYCQSGQWLQDYELDEQGLLPEGLKRGVLGQDALYDLLQRGGEER